MKEKLIEAIKTIDTLFEDDELHSSVEYYTHHITIAREALIKKLGGILAKEAIK